MELVFKYIEDKYNEFQNKELKSDLYYAKAIDDRGCHLGEVNGECSFCEDCQDEARKDFNKMLKKDKSELDINCCDDELQLVKEIIMLCEESPERDDFCNCEYCGSLISVGVLHGFSQEIDHYLGDDQKLHIKHLSNDDCYRIWELINNSGYTNLIAKLKAKIINQNN